MDHSSPYRRPRNGPSRPTQGKGKGKHKQATTAARPALDAKENAGTAAWRRNEEPRETIEVKVRIDIPTMSSIAAATGTYCQLRPHPRAICIWGSAELVSKAKALLETQIAGSGAPTKDKWAHVRSLTPAQWKVEEKTLAAEAQKQRYRRNPPLDTEHEAIATMPWPNDVEPLEAIFGTNLQALDPIRLECSCYIIYDQESGGVQAMGKRKNAMTAIIRVRTCLYQVIARQHQPSKSFQMVQDRESKGVVTIATIQPSQVIWPAPSAYPRPTDTHDTPRLHTGLSRSEDTAGPRRARLARKVKDQVMQTLNKIKYLSGIISFNVQLGILVMSHYLTGDQGQYTLASFDKVLQDGAFEGAVTQEIGDRKVEADVFSRITNAKDLLETQSTLTIDPDDGGGLVEVTKCWMESGDDDLVDQTGPTWYRLEHGARPLLETCIVDLEDGFSWKFEIVAKQLAPVEKLPQALQELGQYHINIKAHEARDFKGSDIWCEFEKHGNGQPRLVARKKRLELQTSWEFGIKDSSYVAILSKTQRVDYALTGRQIAGFETATVFEPRWTLRVKHLNWNVNFVQNANLGMGRGAEWRADLETWFPMDDSVLKKEPGSKVKGYVALMEKLFKLQSILRGDGPRMFRGVRLE